MAIARLELQERKQRVHLDVRAESVDEVVALGGAVVDSAGDGFCAFVDRVAR